MVLIVVNCLHRFVLSCLSEGFERSAQASLAIATVGTYYFNCFFSIIETSSQSWLNPFGPEPLPCCGLFMKPSVCLPGAAVMPFCMRSC